MAQRNGKTLPHVTRRRILQAGAGALLARATLRRATAQAKPAKLVYGNIGPAGADDAVFQEGTDLFTKATGIPVDIQLGGDADLFQKILAWVASGQQLDAVFVRENFLAPFVKDQVLRPVDGMPGLDALKPQITPLFLQSIEQQGKTWGLPTTAKWKPAGSMKTRSARPASPRRRRAGMS